MSPRNVARSIRGMRGVSVGPFQAITLLILIVVGALSFFAATYLQVFDDGSGEPHTAGANSFSRSAIGHRAFAETLRKLGIPVIVSRFDSLGRAGPNSLLLVIEPELDGPGAGLVGSLRRVPHALLVLPKWAGRRDAAKPIWIDRMKLLPSSEPEAVLKAAGPGGGVTRQTPAFILETARFHGRVSIDDPQFFSADGRGGISPVLSAAGGILLGASHWAGHGDDNTLWILSDPDLLSNSGIGQADNGVVAVAIVEALLPKGGTVIIDETAHGFEQRPNLFRVLLHPPFVTVTVSALLALLLTVWAGAIRFGAPRSEAEALPAGKLTLVRNAAKLLRAGTGAADLLRYYRRLVVADSLAELHGPTGLDESAQAAWLDRAARNRGLEPRLAPLLDRISAETEARRLDSRRALGFAVELHRWKQEISHGTGLHPHRR